MSWTHWDSTHTDGDVVPPGLEMTDASTCCGVIDILNLLALSIFESIDQWCDGNGVHRNCKWVPLGSTHPVVHPCNLYILLSAAVYQLQIKHTSVFG